MEAAGDGSTTETIDEESSKEPLPDLGKPSDEVHSSNGAFRSSNGHNGTLSPPSEETDVTSTTGVSSRGTI